MDRGWRTWPGRLGRWLFSSSLAERPVVDKPCPRCGARVEVPVVGTKGFAGYFPQVADFPPTVAWVVRTCGCDRLGVPPLRAWRERARRPFASW